MKKILNIIINFLYFCVNGVRIPEEELRPLTAEEQEAFFRVKYLPTTNTYVAMYKDKYIYKFTQSDGVYVANEFSAAHIITKLEAEKLIKLYKEQFLGIGVVELKYREDARQGKDSQLQLTD
jgi:hypothetical protein